jgi:hypothetical protein
MKRHPVPSEKHLFGGLSVHRIGVVQQWWTKYDALEARSQKTDYWVLRSEKSELFSEFPTCVGELVPAKTTASTQKAEPRK